MLLNKFALVNASRVRARVRARSCVVSFSDGIEVASPIHRQVLLVDGHDLEVSLNPVSKILSVTDCCNILA